MLCWVIWPELKERTARIGHRGCVVFLDRGVTLVLLCFTQLICVGFCLNILVSSSLRRYARVVWGRDIKIG